MRKKSPLKPRVSKLSRKAGKHRPLPAACLSVSSQRGKAPPLAIAPFDESQAKKHQKAVGRLPGPAGRVEGALRYRVRSDPAG